VTPARDPGLRPEDAGGFRILVGRGARDNDRLTFRVARPDDLWLHAAGFSGSHVVVQALEGRTAEVPADVAQRAAELAVWHSKARGAGGKVSVHVCRVRDVTRRRGAPPGQVVIRKYETMKVYSRDPGKRAD
jgi:predicted ribosome quality control (RQC) complex YloA/Tae2 family protein